MVITGTIGNRVVFTGSGVRIPSLPPKQKDTCRVSFCFGGNDSGIEYAATCCRRSHSRQRILPKVPACGIRQILIDFIPPSRSLEGFCMERALSRVRGNLLPSFVVFSAALKNLYGFTRRKSLRNTSALQSLGMRQSPRGESATEPTFTPSGKQERLNC